MTKAEATQETAAAAAAAAAPQQAEQPPPNTSRMATLLKTAAASALLYSAVSMTNREPQQAHRRRLSMMGDGIPSYMDPLMQDLRDRKKLFDDTPPEEVKYWFEYSGPLQVSIVFWDMEIRGLVKEGLIHSPCLFCFVLFCFVLLLEILLSLFQISCQGRLF